MLYEVITDGIEADGLAVRRFAQAMPFVLVASSFSKSFSLYGRNNFV